MKSFTNIESKEPLTCGDLTALSFSLVFVITFLIQNIFFFKNGFFLNYGKVMESFQIMRTLRWGIKREKNFM